MRAILTKGLTASMIAGAALFVTACGESTPATTDNTVVTDTNAMEPMDGTMTDNMTAVDGAMATDPMMANDMMMTGNGMMATDPMMANGTMTNGAMMAPPAGNAM